MRQAAHKISPDQDFSPEWKAPYDFGRFAEQEIRAADAAARAEEARQIEEAIARIRMQLVFIIASVRSWRARHDAFDHPVRRRYSAYEGAMCLYDLKRHWALYRHAMKERGQYQRKYRRC